MKLPITTYCAVIMIVKRNDVRRPRITRGGLRVSFSDVPEEVREPPEDVTNHSLHYLSTISRQRFRRELEGCASTSVKETSSSTLILIAVIVFGLSMAAMAACLPLLMVITLAHVFRSHDDAVDTSISIGTLDLDSRQHATALKES
eukprot:scaffold3705_cov107-Skeletonema_dohrnii-CCMP3373.AAC.3